MSFTVMRNGLLYDALHENVTQDIPFYVARALETGGPVLELCSGTGRVTLPLARAGLDVVGIEINDSMLEHARRKARREGANIEFVKADATRFVLDRAFQLIIAPYNSVQLLHDNAAVRSFFACARDHLRTGGSLIFDVLNPNLDLLAPSQRRRRHDGAIRDPVSGTEIRIELESTYDDARQIHDMTFRYSSDTDGDLRYEKLAHRCFFPQEIDMLVELCGFELVEKCGDFSGKPFEAGDRTQILVCRPR